MAGFGAENTSISPISNSIQPETGVEEAPVLLAGANQLLDQVGSIFAERKASRNEAFVSDFLAQQVSITDALEQGSGGIRTAAQARTRMRANFQAALSANPSLRGELVKAQESVLGLFGDRELLTEGTLEEQRLNDRRDQLVSAGYVDANATDQEFEQADQSARLAVAAKDRFDEQMRTINMRLAAANLSDRERASLEAEKKNEAIRFIQDSSPSQMQSLRTQFNNVLNGAGSEAEKQQAIEDMFISWRSEANALVGEVAVGEFNAFLKPFEDLKDTFISRATGELSDDQVNREIERITATQKLIALSDPVVANLAAASDLFSDSIFQQALCWNERN